MSAGSSIAICVDCQLVGVARSPCKHQLTGGPIGGVPRIVRSGGDRAIPVATAPPILAIGDVFIHASAPLDAREILDVTTLDDLVRLSHGPVIGGLRPSRRIHKSLLLSKSHGWKRTELVRLAPRDPAVAEHVRPLAGQEGRGSNGQPHG